MSPEEFEDPWKSNNLLAHLLTILSQKDWLLFGPSTASSPTTFWNVLNPVMDVYEMKLIGKSMMNPRCIMFLIYSGLRIPQMTFHKEPSFINTWTGLGRNHFGRFLSSTISFENLLGHKILKLTLSRGAFDVNSRTTPFFEEPLLFFFKSVCFFFYPIPTSPYLDSTLGFTGSPATHLRAWQPRKDIYINTQILQVIRWKHPPLLIN